ncbi:MAG: M23 family metallopeptidase [Alphaproteobacteria bacterium]|nr:M23 family metallopeptidase [Alphaproteobacteria bacterium]
MKNFLSVWLMAFFLVGCTGANWWNNDSITVRKGDTLYSLSRKYNVPIKEMINTNHLSSPYTLRVGQKLKLPAKKYHIVKKGESLYSISRQYNVDITTLSKVNKLRTPYTLSVGQKLLLPASVSAQQTTYKNQNVSTVKATGTSAGTVTAQKKTETYVPPKERKTKFLWPVNGKIISGFGNLGSGRKNDGINIKANLGTPVKAADAGTVAYAGNELKGFGNLVLLKHHDGWITAYAHNDTLLVKKGQKVVRGEKIATVGSTGSVTIPQLHFEVRSGKKAVNPRPYLP